MSKERHLNRCPLIGTWISTDEDSDAVFVFSGVGDQLHARGYSKSDGEPFEISQIKWDRQAVSFVARMPSTNTVTQQVFRARPDGTAEHQLTVYETWVKKAVAPGEPPESWRALPPAKTKRRKPRKGTRLTDDPLIGTWIIGSEDTDLAFMFSASGKTFHVAGFTRSDGKPLEISQVRRDGQALSFISRQPSTNTVFRSVFRARSDGSADHELTTYETWVKGAVVPVESSAVASSVRRSKARRPHPARRYSRIASVPECD